MARLDKKAKELNNYIQQMLEKVTSAQRNTCLNSPSAELSLQELKVIGLLGERGPAIMRDIAAYLGLAMSTGTGIVDKLVVRGFVTRERNDEDRRVVTVALTDAGQEMYQMYQERNMGLSFSMLESLTEKEQDTLLSLMRKIVSNMNGSSKVK